MHPFSLEFTKKPKSVWSSANGYILENGIRIARFSRKGMQGAFISPIECKFLSGRAQARFSDFTGELSVEETIEAIYPADISRDYHAERF